MNIRWISIYDVMCDPEAKKCIEQDDLGKFYEILYDCGFDISRGVEYQDVYCRSLTDHRIVSHGRWAGVERTDSEWMKSDVCSFENRIHANAGKDRGLVEDLVAMSSVYNYTGELIKHMEDAFGKSTEYENPNEPDAIFEMVKISEKYKNNMRKEKHG